MTQEELKQVAAETWLRIAQQDPLLARAKVAGKTYPRPLPDELQPWYCYPSDGGHSILCVVKGACEQFGAAIAPGADLIDFMVPVPVKSVLRAGYSLLDGYIVVDLPYDRRMGLMAPAEDQEW